MNNSNPCKSLNTKDFNLIYNGLLSAREGIKVYQNNLSQVLMNAGIPYSERIHSRQLIAINAKLMTIKASLDSLVGMYEHSQPIKEEEIVIKGGS